MPGTRRKRSAAWRYFKLIDGRAVCQINHCTTELTWHGSTTALNAHLQSRHSDLMKIGLEHMIVSAENPVSPGQIRLDIFDETDFVKVLQQDSREMLVTGAWLLIFNTTAVPAALLFICQGLSK